MKHPLPIRCDQLPSERLLNKLMYILQLQAWQYIYIYIFNLIFLLTWFMGKVAKKFINLKSEYHDF